MTRMSRKLMSQAPAADAACPVSGFPASSHPAADARPARIAISLAGLAAAAVLTLALTGCGAQADSISVNAAIVCGNTDNQAVYDYSVLDSSTSGNEANSDISLRNVALSGGKVAVIEADGSPYSVLGSAQSAAPESVEAQTRTSQADKIVDAFIDVCANQAQPRCDQTDLLGAIRCASDAISQTEGTHVIHVFHTMLPTAGLINLAEHPDWVAWASESASEAHSQLVDAAASELPDLSGIDVVLIHEGNTTAPQAQPSDGQRRALEDLWSQILTACGVGEVRFVSDQVATADDAYDYEGSVDTVELPQVSVDFTASVSQSVQESEPEPESDPEPEAASEPEAQPVTIEYADSEVGFIPDTASFIDEAAAQAAIEGLVDSLKSDPAMTVTLYGSVAGSSNYSEQASLDLSQARAYAVAALIIQEGIDPDRVQVEGLGVGSNEYVQHIPDLDADGTQNENAQANRRVVAVCTTQGLAG